MSQVSARWGMNRIRTIIEGEPNEISKSAATTTKSKIRQRESLTNETLTAHFGRSKNNLTKTSRKSTKTTMGGVKRRRRIIEGAQTIYLLQQNRRNYNKFIDPPRRIPNERNPNSTPRSPPRSPPRRTQIGVRNGNGENGERIKSLGTRPGNKIEWSK